MMISFTYSLQNDHQIKLMNISINSHFPLCVVRTLTFYSLSKFQLYSIILSTIITMLYIRPADLIHLVTGSGLLPTFLYSPRPIPGFWQPPFTSLFL